MHGNGIRAPRKRHMTEEQIFWDIMTQKYPSTKSCRTCHYWDSGVSSDVCVSCKTGYTEWKWNPSMAARVDRWILDQT